MFKKDNKKINKSDLNELISTSNKLVKVGYLVAIIVLIVLILNVCKSLHVFKIIKELFIVISPVFIGLLLAWLFDPIIKFLTSKKIPRIISCILVYLLFLGGLTFLIVLLAPSFVNQIKDFITTIPDIIRDSKSFVSDVVNNFAGKEIDLSNIKAQIFTSLEKLSVSLTTNLPNTLMNLVKSLISGGLFVILGIMIGFYMSYDFDKLSSTFVDLLPESWRLNTNELIRRINQSLRGYVSGLFLVMFLVFITQSVALTIVGLKAPLVFALFCAITDVIPYFGPYIGAIPAVLVAFTISPLTGLFCIIAIVIVQVLENNFYQPLIMGHTMKLHPVTIMVGLLIFEHFFGIIGMVIATPAIATIKVIFTFIDEKIGVINKIKGEVNVEEEK